LLASAGAYRGGRPPIQLVNVAMSSDVIEINPLLLLLVSFRRRLIKSIQ